LGGGGGSHPVRGDEGQETEPGTIYWRKRALGKEGKEEELLCAKKNI